MKKKATRLLAMLLCMIMLLSALVVPVSAAGAGKSGSTATPSISDIGEIMNAISYKEYREKYASEGKGSGEIVIDAKDYSEFVVSGNKAELETKEDYYGQSGVLVPETGTVTWKFNVENKGNYIVEIEYCQVVGKTNSIERIFYINGDVPFAEARSIVLVKTWEYEYVRDKDGKVIGFQQDLNGNDIRPNVVEKPTWTTYQISDSNGYESAPFQFYFKEGENTISLESQREPVVIKSIKLKEYVEPLTYEEYLQAHGVPSPSNRPSANATISIHAEAPKLVSAVTMYPVNDRTSSITNGLTGPQSSDVTKYNTAGKEQWQNIGEWMTYDIEVEESGYYSIAVRYKQALLSGMYVSRKIYIDGELPFAEANNCRFPYSSSWQIGYLGNGTEEFEFYLEKGKHTLKLEVSLGEMGAVVEQVSDSLASINSCYLEILKLTGSNPDPNRTYGFSRVMPDVLKTMMIESNNLFGVYDYLIKHGDKGEKASTIEQVYMLLRKMASDESQIPSNLESLKSQIGSLGTWINSVKSQPLQVDEITLQSKDMEMPRGEANFFESFWFEIKLFFASFVTDYNSLGTTSEDGSDDSNDGDNEAVTVWVATGRDQAQIIRNLVDNTFTPASNISVNLKLISAGTLLPSVLAGVGPDVALMEPSTTVIDYALRNALLPLNEHVERDLAAGNDVLSAFPEAAMIPLTLYNYDIETGKTSATYYGLPDSLTFSMMFYRKDVLSSLGLELPKTWDDLLSILPILQYNNMEIGIQNDIYTFIYQNGYEAYADEGMRINFDDTGVLNAFTTLCNMYTQYSLPYTYDFANRFRTGEMPIGISPYTTCNQLSVFATELSGLWSFVPLPGIEHVDENGETYINNSAIATVTGTVMLRGCSNSEDAWEFMKWYTGKECQVAYSNEIVSIVGIAMRPATANTEAIKELPWTTEEANNILAQFDNLVAVPNHPGSYYLARYINFAFLAAYNDGKDPADALLGYVNIINKEITRKRQEFDMYYLETGETLEDLINNQKAQSYLED
ncbi:MAG: extracellular solute-binding protein [Clostridia bacterium]|nr:extracellular solute-binding protein [Clostridia bacterium]